MFISNGDYNFPLDFITYWIKHFYIWTFQAGTPNPDGVIRLPGRLLNFIVFALFGNVAVGYFYSLSCLALAFVVFYFFSRKFLGIEKKWICLVGATFFAVNPIFLGNLAKVGLVLAAVMLPLCLMAIKAAFEKQKLRYLLLYVLFLNISLLHPYNFTVNAAVSGLYLLYIAWQHKEYALRSLPKLAGLGVVALLLNAYMILPIASMGTISKDIISNNVTPIAADYTALVDFSNTGDILTGLSLSKHVFLDFAFYNPAYEAVYYIGTFLLYVILLYIYLQAESRIGKTDKHRLVVLLGCFLALILLAAVTYLNFDIIIKFLIGMPGGWAFRSPLKWQLYIPLVLFGMLVILLQYLRTTSKPHLLVTGLALAFVLMNSYLLYDVYRMQLVPRQFKNFAALQAMDLDQKTLLFINNNECMQKVIPYNSPNVTELNQIFVSKNVQVKRAWIDSIKTINLGSYDYVLSCRDNLGKVLGEQYGFAKRLSFVGGGMELYANQRPRPAVYAETAIYTTSDNATINTKNAFVTKSLGQRFNFVPEAKTANLPTVKVKDVFEDISLSDVQKGKITARLDPAGPNARLRLNNRSEPLYYRLEGSIVRLSSAMQPGYQILYPQGEGLALPPLATGSYSVELDDRRITDASLITNDSFEQDLWQRNVWDCYHYDQQPDLDMKRSSQASTKGDFSLELQATRHIACTGPNRLKVKSGDHYLLSFDYQSLDGKFAGYSVSYKDVLGEDHIVRLPEDDGKWHAISQEIVIPQGTNRLDLKLFAYPNSKEQIAGIARYDNVALIKIPPLQDRLYLTDSISGPLSAPAQVKYTVVNPTKKHVTIKAAAGPFYLASSETYHPLWKLMPAGDSPISALRSGGPVVGPESHLALNGTMNAWYIDPRQVCEAHRAQCIANRDGSYDIELAMEFVPQRSVYIGLMVSAVTLFACLFYLYFKPRLLAKHSQHVKIWRARLPRL